MTDSRSQLVSVVAISYNQESEIVELLQSLNEQGHENIELIISDDCSTDETLKTAKKWLSKNKAKFKRSIILESERNLGICANVSKGIEAASGEWIKIIACDDVLVKNAIESLIDYALANEVDLVFSPIIKFKSLDNLSCPPELMSISKEITGKFDKPLSLLETCRVINIFLAPGAFFKKSLYISAGGIDKRYKHLDDWPLWMNMLQCKPKIGWYNVPLVMYRSSTKSVSQSQTSKNIFLHDDLKIFYRQFQYKKIDPETSLIIFMELGLDEVNIRFFKNSKISAVIFNKLKSIVRLTIRINPKPINSMLASMI